jgi:predicted membrane-bound spermidine synthase
MNIEPVQRWNLMLSAGAVATSLVLATPGFAFSLALGAMLETINFRGMHRAARFIVFESVGGARGWIFIFALRFTLLSTAIGAAIYFGANAVGLLIGLSLIVPAVLIEAWRIRPTIDPDAPTLDADDPSWESWNPWLAREGEELDSDEENR